MTAPSDTRGYSPVSGKPKVPTVATVCSHGDRNYARSRRRLVANTRETHGKDTVEQLAYNYGTEG